MKFRLLWVAWRAVAVMAVVVIVAAFAANEASDQAPAPAQVHRDPRILPKVALTIGAAVPARTIRRRALPILPTRGTEPPVVAAPGP